HESQRRLEVDERVTQLRAPSRVYRDRLLQRRARCIPLVLAVTRRRRVADRVRREVHAMIARLEGLGLRRINDEVLSPGRVGLVLFAASIATHAAVIEQPLLEL